MSSTGVLIELNLVGKIQRAKYEVEQRFQNAGKNVNKSNHAQDVLANSIYLSPTYGRSMHGHHGRSIHRVRTSRLLNQLRHRQLKMYQEQCFYGDNSSWYQS